MAHHILINQCRVLLCMRQHVRTWTHKTHITLQHIQELRQLINIRLTHKVSEWIFSGIILRGLQAVGILIHMHRAELHHHKCLAVDTSTSLLKEQRTRTLYLDNQPDKWEHECRWNQEYQRANNIKSPLHSSVPGILQWILVGCKHLHIIQHLTLQVQSDILHAHWHVVESDHLVVAESRDTLDDIPVTSRQTYIQFVTQLQLVGFLLH